MRSVPIDVTPMTSRPTPSPFSQGDVLFGTYVDLLPEVLREAMVTKGLMDPGLLKAYPRASAEILGLVGTAVVQDELSAVAPFGADCGPSLQSPPATVPTSALDPVQTLHDTPRMLGPTAFTTTDDMTPTTTAQQRALHEPQRDPTTTTTPPSLESQTNRVKRTRAVRQPKSVPRSSAASGNDILRKSNESPHRPHGGKTVECLVESAKVGKSSGLHKVVKKFEMDPALHGKSFPSSLNDTFEQSERARETANPVNFDGSKDFRKADERSLRARMEATDSNKSTDSRASQDGEQNNDGVLIDQCIDGDRWESEPKDARSSQDREPIVDDIVIHYRTLVKKQSTPTGLREGILELGPSLFTMQLTDNSGRTQPSRMSRQQSYSTTSIGRRRKSSEATKSAVDQVVAAALHKPRAYRTRLQRRLYSGPTPRKDAEEMERARWIEALATLLRATQTPMGKMLIDKPLGAGRRVTTLRSRVRLARRYLAWLSITCEVPFPTALEHKVDYFRVRASEPCTRGTLKNTHRSFTFLEEVAGVPKTECVTENPVYHVLYGRRRHGRVGGLRDPAQKLQSGDLDSQSRMVCPVDKGNGEQTSCEHGQL